MLDLNYLDIHDTVYFPVMPPIRKKYKSRLKPLKYQIFKGEIIEMTDTNVVIKTKSSVHNRPLYQVSLSKVGARKIKL